MRARGVGHGSAGVTSSSVRGGLLPPVDEGTERPVSHRSQPKNRLVVIVVGCALLYTAILWVLEVPW